MCWQVLIGIRVLLLFMPLTGYIHPDEFFQSVEVVAGNILDLKVHRPWEFGPESTDKVERIRNVFWPYATVGIPIWLMKGLFGVSLITPYAVLVVSRLANCILSLSIDLCMSRLCKRHGANSGNALFVLGSSYVTLTYFGRTLSNSIEAVLFALLIDTVSQCLHGNRSQKTRVKSRLIKQEEKTSKSTRISLILVLGIYNRPTFVLFALVPMLFWTIGSTSFHLKNAANYFKKVVSLLPGFLILGLILTVIDTVYYDPEFLTKFLSWTFTMEDVIVTPLNFVLYNCKSSNLAIHGLHSRWTHILINQPLLFGPLSFTFMLILDLFESTAVNVTMSSVDWLMKGSVAGPLLLMSLFSHQEPRFLIGLIFPLAFLYGERIRSGRILNKFWIIFNIFCCFLFGFLHQGGVVPSLSYIHNHHLQMQRDTNVVYYHTYMPPRFLLLNEQSKPFEIKLRDLMGASADTLRHAMEEHEEGILVSPSSLRKEIQETLRDSFNLHLNTTLKLHLSMEDPPPFNGQFLHYLGMDIHTVKRNS